MLATAENAGMLCLSAHLAFQVVFEDAWLPGGADVAADGSAPEYHVVKEADGKWMRPEDIGPFDSWYNDLGSWTPRTSVHPGCTLLTDRVDVVSQLSIMDSKCPTLPVCWYLKRHGWIAIDKLCTHRSFDDKTSDSTEAVKMKTYYQVLVRLRHCLPLTRCIPSREPIHYYRLLLAGQVVEPGQPSTTYLCVMEFKRG